MTDKMKPYLLWVVVIVMVFFLFNNMNPAGAPTKVDYSEITKDIDENKVKDVSIKGSESITVELKDGSKKIAHLFPNAFGKDEMAKLKENGVVLRGMPLDGMTIFSYILWNLPILLLIGLWLYSLRQMQGGNSSGRGGMPFGRSRARMLDGDRLKVRFSDVAGCDEAKVEVQEFVDFLKDPKKFQRLGGKIPCGALLVGQPGTGKTLLAKAVAGEADVPFFTISGSDFVEMFVGVGASRVRDMFDQAKRQAPCIIFIDEIDAVGRHRGAGLGGGHDEREQTLNQLLVEMDGFEGKEGVIVMAATNRPDVLDPALLRPGRFDRQVIVPLPDVKGREQILKVHLKKVAKAVGVKAGLIARGTPGFSGADLANLVNEAALIAARTNKRKVGMEELERAKDKIMMGAERHSMVMNEQEKKNTAYHESGHAIVGYLVPDHDPVYKVSIIPRGRALGVTMYLPEEDKYSMSLQKLESNIASLYGGRIAEELIFGSEAVTTGASNDIERATELARNIVTRWGLSSLGPINYGAEEGEVFLGKGVNKSREFSDETAHQIDIEVKKLIDRNYQRATKILQDNMDKLHLMADALMKYETIDDVQIKQIMSGKEATAPKDWLDDQPSTDISEEDGTTEGA